MTSFKVMDTDKLSRSSTSRTRRVSLRRAFSRDWASPPQPVEMDDLEHTLRSESSSREEDDFMDMVDRTAHFKLHSSILKCKTQKESVCRPVAQSQNAHHRKNVDFSTLTIQSYPTILSDHPCTIYGPAVGLDWTVVDVHTTTVDQDSTSRNHPDRRPGQSRVHHLYLDRWTRERTLLALGYSRDQLQQAEREAKRIRALREKNAKGFPNWMLLFASARHLPPGHPMDELNSFHAKEVAPRSKKSKARSFFDARPMETREEVVMWMSLENAN